LQGRPRRWTRRLHRLLGLASCVFLLLIAVTGLALNHADRLGLSQRSAAAPFVLALYGVDAPPVDVAFEAGGSTYALAGGFLVVDDRIVAESRELLGAIAVGRDVLALTDEELLLFAPGGALVERASLSLPAAARRLGTDGDVAVIDAGALLFEIDTAAMNARPAAESGAPDWSIAATLSDGQVRQIGTAVLGRTYNGSRVLNDLHSGRLFPGLGPLIADLAALCLVYLAASGLYLALRRNR